MNKLLEIIEDDKGTLSCGRVLLLMWTGICVWRLQVGPSADEFRFLLTVYVPLLTLVTTGKVATLLMPQLGSLLDRFGKKQVTPALL